MSNTNNLPIIKQTSSQKPCINLLDNFSSPPEMRINKRKKNIINLKPDKNGVYCKCKSYRESDCDYEEHSDDYDYDNDYDDDYDDDDDNKYDKYETYPKQSSGGGSKNIPFHSGKGTRAKLAIYNKKQ